jgi:S1-C subfamily serine protease
LSDVWFYGSKRRTPERQWLYIVLIIVLVVASNVVSSTLYTRSADNRVAGLKGEIESLRYQTQSVSYEVSVLRDSLNLQGGGNASVNFELTRLYNQTRRSVVLIEVRVGSGGGQGSGFVYDEQGHIITNNHVVEDAEEITVTFIDGTYATAMVVGRDPYVDLAVIKVDVADYLLTPVRLGNSSKILVGEQVIALGNPFGLANTMTSGIVSALSRQMSAPGGYVTVDVIQTDAAINPGNSGGPLLNIRGEVIGMNTAIIAEVQQFSGVGFAVPSDTMRREIHDLINEGEYKHPYLGITGSALTPEIKERMELEPSTRGTLVVAVVDFSPADHAGLRGGNRDESIDGFPIKLGGDIIIGIDGRVVNDFYDLQVYMERYTKPGDTIVVEVIRDNDVIELPLTLGIRPDN